MDVQSSNLVTFLNTESTTYRELTLLTLYSAETIILPHRML